MNHDIVRGEATREAKSITHKHIMSVINSKIAGKPIESPIRILDAGCGNCELIVYLLKFLPKFNPTLSFEVFGFDVTDSKVQFSDYCGKANRMLSERLGPGSWENRVRIISSKDEWPFENESFDVVISNQVVEHLHNHDFFFSQNWRVLKNNGFAVYLFPTKNYIIEGHLHLPFVHRFKQWRLLYASIKILSALRLGRWKRIAGKCTLDAFSSSYADFLIQDCNYVSIADLL